MSSGGKNKTVTSGDIHLSIEGLLATLKDGNTSESEGGEIECLDQQFDSLQAIQYGLSLRITQNRRHRNSFAPFHRLPAELVVTTFQLVLQNAKNKWFFQLANITRVSSAWRAIVLSSPALWAFITRTAPTALVELALERSQNHPLDVISDSLDIFKLLIPVMPRIRSADLSISKDTTHVFEFANLPAPLLETLDLGAGMEEFDAKEGVDLFKGQAPRLERISLRGISIRWDSAILLGLKSLELSNLTHGSPSLTQLLQILSQSPKLTSLTLMDIRLRNETSPNTDTPLPIILPNLKSLYIDGLKLSYLLSLLESIRFPLCRALNLGFGYRRGSTSGIPPTSVAHLGPSIAAAVASHQNMEIKMGRGSIEFNVMQHDNRSARFFTMRIPTTNLSQYLQWLADLLPRPTEGGIPALKVSFQHTNLADKPTILGILDRMKVTHLILQTEEETDSICQHLANPIPSSPVGHRWIFTNLRHLQIQVRSNLESLLQMLGARYPRPAAENVETTELPLRLESLNIVWEDGFNAAEAKMARDMFGLDVVRWDGMSEEGSADGKRTRTRTRATPR